MLPLFRVTDVNQFAIGVDLGGTNLRASAVAVDGRVLEDFQISTEAQGGPDHIVQRIVEGVREVNEGHTGSELIGVGVGVPGLIRLETGVIAKAPNLRGWEEYPLKQKLEQALELPVMVENDANAAALGEVWLGAGRDVNDLVLLTLGTGIGGGIVCDGKILHGWLGMAGEIGHVTVDPHSPHICGCGNNGCLETESAGTAIRKMALQAVEEGRSPALAALLENEGQLTPLLCAQAADGGDPAAREIFEHVGWGLGIGLAGLINTFNFPLYLLAGGVLAAWDLFAPAMMREVERRSLTYRNTNTRIEKASLGNKAGIYGAAYLPIQAAREPRP
ncbi:MAG: ROK family protein [Acidobacteria bacterium]|nr:ROK family protein [Acidobacteriota bacterium]